jgi:sugar phosphate isomerase/epimerase
MHIPGHDGWLGYCLNVHPTQTLAEVEAALRGPVRAVKALVSPDRPFAVGLRLAAEAAADTAAATALLGRIFAEEGYVAYTMNGFPYGPFHGTPVKEAVYAPDWTTAARRRYTADLAEIMAALVPVAETATISTVPGGFAPEARGREAEIADGLLQSVADLVALERRTGRTVALALEPEPWCLLDTTADAVAFFRDHLFTDAAAGRLATLAGLSLAAARAALPRHLGLCLDVCHMAVAFEAPGPALRALADAGVPIHKVQLSAALRVPAVNDAARTRLAAFQDDVYLHQVVARAPDGTIRRFLDLPAALAATDLQPQAEWRVHFHVPVFAELAAPVASTRDVLERVLALHRDRPIARHLEVETYTWDVLPPDLHQRDPATGIAKEMAWVTRQLC